MRYLRLSCILFFVFAGYGLNCQENDHFYHIFPLQSFKKVVDTCMRSYTDVLLLHDLLAQYEKYDEQLDLLVTG